MAWLLVAEDNDDLREHLAEALRERGYEVRAVADGAEVIPLLYEADEMPAVLLLDLMMPRVSGREVIRAMRSYGRARRVPIIVLSATSMDDAERSQLGVETAFLKPVPVETLFAAIDRVSGAKPGVSAASPWWPT